jgi:HAD superfamily hydrolase (TIGR01509 family)
MNQIRAITFDLFGTLTCWTGESPRWLSNYAREVHAITKGEKPWRPIAQIMVGAEANFADLEVRPGVRDALYAMSDGRLLSLLSNAGSALGTELMYKLRLPLDPPIETEKVRAYKPDPRVYCLAARRLRYEPEEILHVAAHAFDLRGARAMGMRTAYIRWPGYRDEEVTDGEFDYVETSLAALAERLSAEATS